MMIFSTLDIFGENKYKIYDAYNKIVIDTFDNYNQALNFYNNNLDKYENLVLYEDDIVLLMEYGIVEFKTNDECNLNVGYRSLVRNKTTSINGCYGIDALYLGKDGNDIYFLYAGDYGFTDFESIILHPFDSLDVRISLYRNKENELVHLIKTQLDIDYYANAIKLNKAPSYFKEGVNYYSYDGHYFYEDFMLMSDDYRNNDHQNAVNKDYPYYNYFQYLSFRSLSNYSANETVAYFENDLKINGSVDEYVDNTDDGANDIINKSEYYNHLDAFFIYQNIYGTNALNTLAISMLDSFDGKSIKAYTKHDLFLKNAYDNDKERGSDAFENVEKSIYAFDKYILSGLNGDYESTYYAGSFLGDKLSGYTVYNSFDAYYGEKASSNYYLLDKAMGSKDNNAYCLGIIYDLKNLNFYDDDNLKNLSFTLYDLHNYSLVILKENEKAYKVQIDSKDDNYKYDFENNIAYIDKQDIDLLINEDKMHEHKIEHVHYDFNGGLLNNEKTLDFIRLEDVALPSIRPYKEGSEFAYFNKDNIAQYKEIEKISIYSFPYKEVLKGSYLNLKGAKIKIDYANGTSSIKNINSDMINSFDNSKVGSQEIIVSYCGLKAKMEIYIKDEELAIKDDIDYLVAKNIESFKKEGTYDLKEIEKIKDYLKEVSYRFDFNKLREIDAILYKEYHQYVNFVISDNSQDISVSGLCLNIDDDFINKKYLNGLIKNTFYIRIKKIDKNSYNLLKAYGQAYGFECIYAFKPSFYMNMQKMMTDNEMIYTIKLKKEDRNSTYTVYALDNNGDVVKCKTYWSGDSITFISDKQGPFMIYKKDSFNTYYFDIPKENINYYNNDPDIQNLFVVFISYMIVFLFGLINIIYHYLMEYKINKYRMKFKKVINIK